MNNNLIGNPDPLNAKAEIALSPLDNKNLNTIDKASKK